MNNPGLHLTFGTDEDLHAALKRKNIYYSRKRTAGIIQQLGAVTAENIECVNCTLTSF